MEELLFFGLCPFLVKAGCNKFLLGLSAVFLSSVSIAIFYYANKLGIKWFSKRVKRKTGPSRLERFCRICIRKLGYVGLASIYLSPQIPGLRETTLAICQGFDLRYTLPIALCFNLIKWSIVFQFLS